MSKRFFTYIILAAAAVTASCTKNTVDLPYGGAISFAPVASKATKAIIQDAVYPEGESFVVSAYHNGTNAYFEDLTAGYSLTQNGVKLWETSEAQYWPLAGSLTFNAYSPSSASGVTITSAGVTATDYTIQTSDQMTTDLCYASATVADCADHPESVPLVFSHALSQVVFRVKAAAKYSGVSLSMNSLSLSGLYSVGNFNAGVWSSHSSPYTYTLSNSVVPLTYTGDEPDVTTISTYLFLPQTFSADAAINVGYSIVQTVAGETYTLDNPPVAIPLKGTLTQWQPGKKYIYTLSIGMNNLITFTASTYGWTEEEVGLAVE